MSSSSTQNYQPQHQQKRPYNYQQQPTRNNTPNQQRNYPQQRYPPQQRQQHPQQQSQQPPPQRSRSPLPQSGEHQDYSYQETGRYRQNSFSVDEYENNFTEDPNQHYSEQQYPEDSGNYQEEYDIEAEDQYYENNEEYYDEEYDYDYDDEYYDENYEEGEWYEDEEYVDERDSYTPQGTHNIYQPQHQQQPQQKFHDEVEVFPYTEDADYFYSETNHPVPKLPPIVKPLPDSPTKVLEVYETVNHLRSNHIEQHVNSMFKLNEFVSESSKMEEVVIEAGGIQVVSSCLVRINFGMNSNRNTIIHLKERYIHLLSKLSKSPHLNWTQVVVAIDYLVLYLSRGTSESPEHRKSVIQVIRKIGQEPEAKERFLSVGGFRIFIRLLGIHEPEFKELDLKVLGLMFINQPAGVEEVIQVGGSEIVCDLLQTPITSLRTLAAGFIWAMAAFPNGKDNAREIGVIPRIVNLFSDRDDSVRWHAAGALIEMCRKNEENRMAFSVSGVVGKILDQLEQIYHQRQKKRLVDCLYTITYLSGPGVRKAVFDSGALDVLLRIKEAGYDSLPVREGIDAILLNLSARNISEDSQTVWLRPGEITIGKHINSGPVAEFHYQNGDVYKGAWASDKRLDGYGIMEYGNGEKYEGNWKDRKRHGRGKWKGVLTKKVQNDFNKINNNNDDKIDSKSPESERDGKLLIKQIEYDGMWVDDKFHGEGIMVYSNGDRYTGQWKFGMREGKGKCVYSSDNSWYEGDWVRDIRQGNGVAVLTTGDKFTGEWVNDLPKDGINRLEMKNKCEYFGELKKGKRNGFGILTQPDRSCYIGFWEENLRSGLGKYISYNGVFSNLTPNDHHHHHRHHQNTSENGDTLNNNNNNNNNHHHLHASQPHGDCYLGYWLNDQKNGYGVFYYENGDVFQGEWKNGRRHGSGLENICDNTSSFCGSWKIDQRHGVGIWTFPSGRKGLREFHLGDLQRPPLALMELEPIDDKTIELLQSRLKISELKSKIQNIEEKSKELDHKYDELIKEKKRQEQKKKPSTSSKDLSPQITKEQLEAQNENAPHEQTPQEVRGGQPQRGRGRGRGRARGRGGSGRGRGGPLPSSSPSQPPPIQSRNINSRGGRVLRGAP